MELYNKKTIQTLQAIHEQESKYITSKSKYHNIICGLDLEVSTVHLINGEWVKFDESINDYDDIPMQSITYLWAVGISNHLIYGRDINSLACLFYDMKSVFDEKTLIIYIHNLAYDFQFLLNFIADFEVFARKNHKVMKAKSDYFNIELRCSYMLTMFSLEKCAKEFQLLVKKLNHNFDYELIRTPVTKLTYEIDYIKNDVLIILGVIKYFQSIYGEVSKIPLTRTGIVRKNLKERLSNKDKNKISKSIYKNVNEFLMLTRVFMGGYTHANALHTGFIHDNVFSKDLTSSYPAVLLQCKFPSTSFQRFRINESIMNDESRCSMALVTFTNLRNKHTYTYMSYSKAVDPINVVIDNGRVAMADTVSFYITNVDYQIMKDCYIWDSVEFNNGWIAEANYLPNEFRKNIIDLFDIKSTMKGVLGQEIEYMMSKGDLNAMYGMCCTNTIRDETVYKNGEWYTEPLTQEQIQDKIKKASAIYNSFVSFSWGVWCTAYARKRLWDIINKIDIDLIYSDTDSLKYLNNHDDVFNEFNNHIRKLNDMVAKQLNVSRETLRDMGEYDNEPTYDRFITYGAKKYAYEINNKIGVTVSGLNKSASKYINKLEDFKIGRVFGYRESGRTNVSYNDNQESIMVKDYQGNVSQVTDLFGIAMRPSTYKLGIGVDFMEYIEMIQNDYSTHYTERG